MAEKMIDFPVMTAEKEEKIEKLVQAIADCTDTAEINIEKVTILRVRYSGLSPDLESVLTQLFGNAGVRVRKYTKPKKEQNFSLSNQKMEKNLDPLGS